MSVGHRFSRRALLAAGGAAAAGAAAAGAAHWTATAGSSPATGRPRGSTTNAAAAGGPVLVVVTLYGGNDGLNTVVPSGDPAYPSARGATALDLEKVLPLGDGYGLHPSLAGLHQLFHAGHLAVVHGVGYPNPNLSHFASMDVWQSGSPDGSMTTGWVGRWLDATGTDPLRALAIGPTVPLVVRGAKLQAAAVPPPPLTLPGSAIEQAAFATMAAAPGRAPLQADAARAAADLLTEQRALAPVLDTGTGTATSGATSLQVPTGGLAIAQGGGGRAGSSVLAGQLDLVAAMVLAGVPATVYAVSFGGFDTHTDEATTQAALLSQLDGAVSGFLGQVAGSPHGRPVVVLVHSEFGRRVTGNASGGTDHGTANVVLVAGSTVKGGFYGEPPSLTTLDADGNLVATTDFRSVYATLAGDVLGVDARDLLGGAFAPVPFL